MWKRQPQNGRSDSDKTTSRHKVEPLVHRDSVKLWASKYTTIKSCWIIKATYSVCFWFIRFESKIFWKLLFGGEFKGRQTSQIYMTHVVMHFMGRIKHIRDYQHLIFKPGCSDAFVLCRKIGFSQTKCENTSLFMMAESRGNTNSTEV